MISYDLHVHSTFSDGKSSPEELIEEALSKGLLVLGFSEHSPVPFDPPGGMDASQMAPYKETITQLKEKYKDRIKIYLGTEQDYYSPTGTEDYDYIIGSTHFLMVNGEYYAVDDEPEIAERCVRDCFNGDYYAYAACYYETEATVVEKTHADIIGHFDLVSKFNEELHWFDESDPRYVAAWKKCIDTLLKTGKPFEINTGAYYRGRRSVPYPTPEMIDYIKERGGRFVLSSDSHRKEDLQRDFEMAEKLAGSQLIKDITF